MAKKSAGLLLYRDTSGRLEVLLVHPGGPFWAKKDDGAWSIPKGEFEDDEDPLTAARREFCEETGFTAVGDVTALEPVPQRSGKVIYAWAMKKDLDPVGLKSNTFSIEWPPKSGRQQEFPEVDRAAWFTIDRAGQKIVKGQIAFLAQLEDKVGGSRGAPPEHTPGSGADNTARQRSLFEDDP